MKEILTLIKYALLILVCFLTVSCSRFENAGYHKEEDKAIIDMVPAMVDAKNMITLNDYGISRPVLYVIEELDNAIEPTEYDSIGEDDQKSLEPLLNAKMEKRIIPPSLLDSYKAFEVRLLTIEDFESNHRKRMVETVAGGGVLGYLSISRVILDSDLKKGYVSFSFFCGEACAWNSTIEIVNKQGVWMESRFLFGGIA